MNIIDKNFELLVKDIEKSTETEIFFHIKERFLLLNEKTKNHVKTFLINFYTGVN